MYMNGLMAVILLCLSGCMRWSPLAMQVLSNFLSQTNAASHLILLSIGMIFYAFLNAK